MAHNRRRLNGIIAITVIIGIVLSGYKFFCHEVWQSREIKTLMTATDKDVLADKESLNKLSPGEYYTFDLSSEIFAGEYSEEEMGDYQIAFKGYINNDAFNSISLGKGYAGPLGDYLYIDTKEIQIRENSTNNILATYAHDISAFKDYISVIITTDLNGNADIQIMTNGGFYSLQNEWISNYGTLFVMAGENTSLVDCRLSYNCNGWYEPIWIFGDSYMSMTEPDRWTTYLCNSGANNYMLNGRSGRGSADALVSLKYCLQYGKPDILVWCLGMNDGDDGQINESYLNTLEEVKTICSENDIELILTTIPTCPYWNNDYKNEYVKNSGYRYIDFAKAVGAYDSITWDEGMLENAENRIHPTESGALALYSEAITVVPELLSRE